MIVVPKTSRLKLLDMLFRIPFDNTLVLKIRLWKNNIVPDLDTLTGTLTPCAFTGYADYSFPAADNPFSALSGTQAQMLLSGTMREWECTAAPETIYGWALLGDDDDLLLVERYDTPHVLIVGSIHRLYPYVNLGKIVGD
jgi:hypothetical protein